MSTSQSSDLQIFTKNFVHTSEATPFILDMCETFSNTLSAYSSQSLFTEYCTILLILLIIMSIHLAKINTLFILRNNLYFYISLTNPKLPQTYLR